MGKILSTISLILALVLFPPASLAVVSNNAVPGDTTYPIKRSLEDVIYTIVSLHPVTKAWFSAARSDRRFKELTVLLTQGKQTEQTLKELVEQTEIASNQITQVTDTSQKEKLIEQLAQSITKYDQKLQQVTPTQPQPTQTTTSTPTLIPTPTPQLLPPQPTITAQSPQPSPQETLRPQPTPSPSPIPTPAQDDIDEARDKLEEIKKKLEKAKEKIQKQQKENNEKDKDNEKKTDGKGDKNGKNKDRKEKED